MNHLGWIGLILMYVGLSNESLAGNVTFGLGVVTGCAWLIKEHLRVRSCARSGELYEERRKDIEIGLAVHFSMIALTCGLFAVLAVKLF